LIRTILFLAASAILVAQDTGVLTGTVTDSSGAIVAAAKVSAVNAATNFESTAETNADGLYRIPFLRPGIYRVMVSAQGFKTFVRDGVELRVGFTLPIHAVMEVGAVAESIPDAPAAEQLHAG